MRGGISEESVSRGLSNASAIEFSSVPPKHLVAVAKAGRPSTGDGWQEEKCCRLFSRLHYATNGVTSPGRRRLRASLRRGCWFQLDDSCLFVHENDRRRAPPANGKYPKCHPDNPTDRMHCISLGRYDSLRITR